MINYIKSERDKQLETKVESRETKVINAQHSGQGIKQLLMDIDRADLDRLKGEKLTPERLEKAQGELSAMKFLADVEKKSKFQNKRM
jgi:hypothetical protein